MNKIILTLVLSLLSLPIFAEVVVIAHPSNGDTFDRKEIENIYLGKSRTFPSGAAVLPLNLDNSVPAREAFDSKVLNKTSTQIKSYWAQKVFTGKGTPPKEVGSVAEMLELVAANPSIIGYVDSSDATDAVKIIGKF